MRTLTDILLADQQRETLVAECVAVVERHLNGLRSMRGLTLKAGVTVFRAAMPDVVERVVRKLMPDFVASLEPLHRRFHDSTEEDFSVFLARHEDEALAGLIAVADRRAAGSSSESVRMAYARLRSGAHSELKALLPALNRVIGRHMDRSTSFEEST